MTKYIVHGDQHVHVRLSPSTSAVIVAKVPTGSEINGELAGAWVKVPLAFAAPVVRDEEYPNSILPSDGYMLASLLSPVSNGGPVVPPVSRTLIGVNAIFDGNAARVAIDAGCKFISVTFNGDLAWELKQQHPELMVASRGDLYKGRMPTLQEWRDRTKPRPGLICYGVNENDQIPCDTPTQIKQRADFDRQAWQVCKDVGATYAGGGWAMGTPNIMVDDVRHALRDYYMPLFNAGMWMNQHTYSGNDHHVPPIPPKEKIYRNDPFTLTLDGFTATGRQTWWLEERCRFYVAYCQFDCTKSLFISDETGLDAPGPFSDFGFTDQEVANWCLEFRRKNSEAMPDGKTYRLIGAALFQSGSAAWKQFEVMRYYPAIKAAGAW